MMPKEVITRPNAVLYHNDCIVPNVKLRDKDLVEGTRCTCTPLWESDPALAVRWNNSGHDREGNIQISLLQYPKFTDEEYRDLRCWPPSDVNETFTSMLSRSEVNVLIKTLRRARDQAYGQDE